MQLSWVSFALVDTCVGSHGHSQEAVLGAAFESCGEVMVMECLAP